MVITGVFSKKLDEETPVMTILDSDFHSDDHFIDNLRRSQEYFEAENRPKLNNFSEANFSKNLRVETIVSVLFNSYRL